jgi:serine/threonine-protein kinase
LINVEDGFHLWSNVYEREQSDVFAIQDDLSHAIIAALQVQLTGDQEQSFANRQPASMAAYNLYLQGRYFWNKRTEEALKKSLEYFQQALDLDPTYALAYAGMADAYNILGSWMYVEPKEAYPKARAAVQRALEIDEGLAEAHAALAHCKYEYDWDWQGAESEYRRALTLNPNYAGAHYGYAKLLEHLGRYDEARVEMEKSLELDPLSVAIHASSAVLYKAAGQYDQAVKQSKAVLEMDPDNAPAHLTLFTIYFKEGRNDDSFNHLLKIYSRLYDLTTAEKETVQRLYNESGWNNVARFMITFLEKKSKEKYVPPVDMIIFYLMLKDHERVLDYLEIAYQTRDPFINDIGYGDVFEALHAEPRFQVLLKKVGLVK